MYKFKKLNQLEFSILIGLIASILFCFFSVNKQSCDIKNHVLRLHILANSNSTKDQNLKLKIRNEIFKNFNFKNYGDNLKTAKAETKKLLPKIEKTAETVVKKEGYPYKVKAELTKMNFTTREYGNFALPAGKYDVLKISIGDAKGKNWWCIINPPTFCVPIKNKPEPEQDSNLYDVLNETQKDLVEKGSKTEIRFWLIEAFNSLINLFG